MPKIAIISNKVTGVAHQGFYVSYIKGNVTLKSSKHEPITFPDEFIFLSIHISSRQYHLKMLTKKGDWKKVKKRLAI